MSYLRKASSTRGYSLFTPLSERGELGLAAEELTLKALKTPLNPDDIRQIRNLVLNSSDASIGEDLFTYSKETLSFHYKLFRSSNFPAAPYGVKGGAARRLMLGVLGIPSLEARDLDLIRKGAYSVSADNEVAAHFMPEDFRHGGKVELFTDMTRYMASRDLTINEVVHIDNELIISPFALLDTLTRTIRPSRYRTGTLSKPPQLSGRTFLKMIRLRSEFLAAGVEWQVVGIPDTVEFTETDLAMQLEKALQHNPLVGESFLSHLVRSEFLPATDPPLLRHILIELQHLTIGENALLRSLPDFNTTSV